MVVAAIEPIGREREPTDKRPGAQSQSNKRSSTMRDKPKSPIGIDREGASAEDIDRQLLRQIAHRDGDAFEELCRRYYKELYRFLFRVMREAGAAEEVANDTLMAVWESAPRFAGQSAASTWIYGIAHKKALKAMRGRRRREQREGEDADEIDALVCARRGPPEHSESLLLRRAIDAALRQLSVEHRAVIELTYFRDYSCSEIAEVLNCPVNTVKTRMFHARARLRELLQACR